MLSENEIVKIVFAPGLKVHKHLDPGLLEMLIRNVYNFEIIKAGLRVEKQKALPLVYEEIVPDTGST